MCQKFYKTETLGLDSPCDAKMQCARDPNGRDQDGAVADPGFLKGGAD